MLHPRLNYSAYYSLRVIISRLSEFPPIKGRHPAEISLVNAKLESRCRWGRRFVHILRLLCIFLHERTFLNLSTPNWKIFSFRSVKRLSLKLKDEIEGGVTEGGIIGVERSVDAIVIRGSLPRSDPRVGIRICSSPLYARVANWFSVTVAPAIRRPTNP